MSNDIKPGDWVTITARVQIHKIERLHAPFPGSPTENAFTAIEFVSGEQDAPVWKEGSNSGWDGTKPAIFTIELPENPTDGIEIDIEKDN